MRTNYCFAIALIASCLLPSFVSADDQALKSVQSTLQQLDEIAKVHGFSVQEPEHQDYQGSGMCQLAVVMCLGAALEAQMKCWGTEYDRVVCENAWRQAYEACIGASIICAYEALCEQFPALCPGNHPPQTFPPMKR